VCSLCMIQCTVLYTNKDVKRPESVGSTDVRFEVFMVVKSQVKVLLVVTPCSVMVGYNITWRQPRIQLESRKYCSVWCKIELH
jgi:hypothetical protein